MSHPHDHSIDKHKKRFQGPRCWVLAALLGLFLGLGVAGLIPAALQHTTVSPEGSHELPRVREIQSDGTRLERMPNGMVRAWTDSTEHAEPAQDSAKSQREKPGKTEDARLGEPRNRGDGPEVRPTGSASHTVSKEQTRLDGTNNSTTTPQAKVGNGNDEHDSHATPAVPLWLCGPFALLLACIAMMPFINAKFWAGHFPDVALGLGGLVVGYYLGAFGAEGRHAILHSLIEYYSFIALVGGLFVVSGGIMIDVRTKATPTANTALLAFGAVLANVVGTTGASMLLIRPFMRMNKGRLRAIHLVMFIFVVSNCGGCLTPIGDPPLYLGFLKGVPFMWTVTHLWSMWLVCVGLLLAVFFVIDSRMKKSGATPAPKPEGGDPSDTPDLSGTESKSIRLGPITVKGLPALGFLVLLVAGVFLDPLLKKFAGIDGLPIGATFQLIVAITAYLTADDDIHNANAFDFHPVEEVGFLFAGIFLTMTPALGYLAANAAKLGLESPTQYYFFAGGLSAVLDNAPTYLNFMQSGLGVLHLPMDHGGIGRFIANTYDVVHEDGTVVHFHGQILLEAISLGAVFFGAMTYIGNGPNFMVKSIAEAQGVKMPSFFAYLGLSCAILLPILTLVWGIFIR